MQNHFTIFYIFPNKKDIYENRKSSQRQTIDIQKWRANTMIIYKIQNQEMRRISKIHIKKRTIIIKHIIVTKWSIFFQNLREKNTINNYNANKTKR